jgi:hypothetical protein
MLSFHFEELIESTRVIFIWSINAPPAMKVSIKLPEIHINPIYRDLFMVMTAGLLIAMALVSIGFIIFH